MSQRVPPGQSGSALGGASPRGSLATLAAFLLGVPLGVVVLLLIWYGPFQEEILIRYTSHPVEMAEVVLFCCALMALGMKFLGYLRERMAFVRALLPKGTGKPQPPGEAATLINHLSMQGGWRGTYLGQRVLGVLEFVHARGSAQELDDQLRTLSDNDAIAQEGSYSLVRFINWAIPILGFLGTVVGITDAIAGVTPEMLEQSLSGVTSGLATAFDTTALALLLTMALMFGTFISERLEQTLLEQVDGYVERHLAHRFERPGNDNASFVAALNKNTETLLGTTEQLVQKQAQVWARSLERLDRQSADYLKNQQAQLTQSIGQALDFALTRFGQRMAEVESNLIQRNHDMVDGVARLVEGLKEADRQHREGLAEIAGRLAAQTETLARMQEGETQLVRLQETLQQNLSTLATSGTFEQAVQSLTAAIHLLTSRVQPGPALKKAA